MRTLLSLLTVLIVAAPLRAHHSFAATYDVNKPVTFTGAVTKVEFRNPHIWVFLDVKDGDKVTNWGCEGGAPIQLFRQGWRPDTLKQGDEISVEGFAARDGKPVCNMRVIKTGEGRRVFAGANDGAPGGAPAGTVR